MKSFKIIGGVLSASLLTLALYQNCAPSFSSDTVSSSTNVISNGVSNEAPGACTGNRILGEWTDGTEVLKFEANCKGTSLVCHSSFSFSEPDPANGVVELSIVSTDNDPTCAPPGTYQCNYLLQGGPTTPVLTYSCPGLLPRSLIPVSSVTTTTTVSTTTTTIPAGMTTTTIPAVTKLVYTADPVAGNFGGVSQADAICNSSRHKPASVRTAKAYIFHHVLSNDTGIVAIRDSETDWVFKPNTNYNREGGSRVYENGKLVGYWSGSQTTEYWTGFEQLSKAGLSSCGNWKNAAVDATGFTTLVYTPGGEFHLQTPRASCSLSKSLFCVEQ